MNGYQKVKNDIPGPPEDWESNYKSIKDYGWYLAIALFLMGAIILIAVFYTGFQDMFIGIIMPIIFISLGVISALFTFKSKGKPRDHWYRELPCDVGLFNEFDDRIQSGLKGHNLSWMDKKSQFIGSIELVKVKTEESTGRKYHKKFKETFLNKEDLQIEYGLFVLYPENENKKEWFLIGINNIIPENSQEALDLAEQVDGILEDIL